MSDAQRIAETYVALWNEPDPWVRRAAIEAFWVPDGRHFVRAQEVAGYDALERRVTGSHEKNVRDAGHRFRARPDARQLQDMVTFHWEMLRGDSEEVLAVGLEVILVDEAGRARVDYQFV